MKLCTFRMPTDPTPAETSASATARVGCVLQNESAQVVDVAALAQATLKHPTAGWDSTSSQTRVAALLAASSSMLSLLQAGPAIFSTLRERIEQIQTDPPPELCMPLERVTLLAPLPRPASLRDCMAFEGHLVQSTRGGLRMLYPRLGRLESALRTTLGISLIRAPKLFRQLPVFYKGNPASVVGPGATVRWPAYSQRLDYELEVALILFETPANVRAEVVSQYIAGYTVFNDFSARDTQLEEMTLRLGPARGKDFDTGNVLGPFLVTPDEVGELRALKARAWINEQLVSDSSLQTLQFTPEEIVAFVAEETRLEAGSVIGLGTVPGGCGLEHGTWLGPGDTIRLEVERIGALSNRVEGPRGR